MFELTNRLLKENNIRNVNELYHNVIRESIQIYLLFVDDISNFANSLQLTSEKEQKEIDDFQAYVRAQHLQG